MDYSGWALSQQNPNPNPVLWQPADYSAYNPHNLNADPYQQPYIAPQNAFVQPHPVAVPTQIPQPQHHIGPPGVDTTPYAAQQVHVQYPEQTYYYEHQPAAAVPGSYYPDPNANWTGVMYGASPIPTGVAAPNPAIQYQIGNPKKKLQKKSKVVQPAWCEVCQIDCNSQDVLDQHKLGKRHKKNLSKLKHMPVVWPSGVATYPTIVASSSTVVANAPATDATLSAAAASSIPPAFAPASSLPETTVTSMPLLQPDLGLINQSIIGPEENPNKAKVSSSAKRSRRNRALPLTGDLETKKRKVLEGGAAANSVRACDICNVVCNSDTVYNYHLAGQRHAAMVKKHGSRAGIGFAT